MRPLGVECYDTLRSASGPRRNDGYYVALGLFIAVVVANGGILSRWHGAARGAGGL